MTPTSETTRTRNGARYSQLVPKVANRATFALLDQAVISGVSFLTGILVGRLCSEAQFGIYTLGMSIVLLAISVQQSLISAPHTIFVARYSGEDRSRYNGIVLLQALALNVIVVTLIGISAGILMTGVGPEGGSSVLLMLLVVCPAVLLREFARRFMFAHFKMSNALILDICIAVIQIGLLLALMFSGNLTGLTGLLAIGIACALTGVVWLAKSKSNFEVDASNVKDETRRSWGFGKWIFGGQVSVALVAVLLNWWLASAKGTDATGAYGACMTLVLLANPFILGIQNLLSPNMAKAMHESGGVEVRRMVRRSTLILSGVMACYAILIAIYGEELVRLIYKNVYVGNQMAITFLGLGALALATGVASNHGLRAIERPEINFYAAGIGLSVAAIVALILIPSQGVLGAAIAYFVSSLVTACLRGLGFMLVSRNVEAAV